MKIQSEEAKVKLVQRLRRIEGQLRGVQQMIETERECDEILQQLSAVRSAVQSASRIFLQEYASTCLLEMDSAGTSTGKREKMIQDMIALLDKAP
jgi:CsoR family transcriptional regulator, copper-sensing transcriptional repressor